MFIAGSSAGAIVGALYSLYGDADQVYDEFSKRYLISKR